MAPILSHPFRVLRNGPIATVEQDSDEGKAEQIAVLVLTHLGERPLAPGFGITDPAFAGVESSEVLAGIQEYGPVVNIVTVDVEWPDDHHADVLVTFD